MEPRYHLLNPGKGDGINIFFAGSGFTYDLAYEVGVRKRLLSWHANTDEEIGGYRKAQGDGRESFGIVDSGAFTVWNKGGEIRVGDYATRLVSLLEHFDIAANLDVIPGKKGMEAREITKAMGEEAAAQGWKNYIYLRDFIKQHHPGERIMPIYHQGESLDWLKKMVDAGCSYIGISPSNDYHTNQRMHWLDDVFDYLCSLPEMPKTHGYAVTSETLMTVYPWFSVDSASWIHKGGLGSVSTPFGDFTFSDRDDIMAKVKPWPPQMQTQIEGYFAQFGITITELKASYRKRWQANAIHMVALERKHEYIPKVKEENLFDLMVGQPQAAEEVDVPAEVQDCFGLTLDGLSPLGEVPMSLHDARPYK